VFPDAEVHLVRSMGGVFEVTVDGKLVFSKRALGRFPAYREVPALI
jgi:selT/selW/selH-like putative selenoprotein